ncbi:MAG TPA: PLP-dependent aminotransferase family protein [Elainellaceae cyanobacterium]
MDLPITLDSNLAIPLHQQLYDELREAILSGRLHPQQKIPSTRSLAKSLGISRTTVTQSYDQLLSEGYLEAVTGSGTYVCAQIPDQLLNSAPVESVQEFIQPSVSLSVYGERLSQTSVVLQPEPHLPINFRYGRPALDQFPMTLWRRLMSRHCRDDCAWLDYAPDVCGYRPLREVIARYLARARAVRCDPEQIIITNGTQQALDLTMRLLINPNETIAMEDPGYLSARRIFQSHGAKLLPVPVDEAGMRIGTLAAHVSSVLGSIRLVYVTPSHQFPTGATLSLSRRLELLAWAQQTGAIILEDDYDSEYRYGDRPIPALQGLDSGNSVLYIGTFSKVLFPSLRIGYWVVPPHLVSIFAHAKWLSDRQLPTLDQKVLTDFIEGGHLESHIRKMRSHYNQLRQTLVHELMHQFGDRVTILGEKAGIHLMIRLHTSLRDDEIINRAAHAGVGLMSAYPHYLTSPPPGELILGYGELSKAQIRDGISQLAHALAG